MESSSGGQIHAPGLARLKLHLGTGEKLVSSIQGGQHSQPGELFR